jgi:AGCS family alanine or glycine:cation symporter
MAAIYVSTALVILILNAGDVPGALATIVTEAFNPKAGLGGTAAGALSVTLLWGVKRGLFSNEAGQGSAPIAHAAAKTDEPVREGAVAMLEPLIDTLIICTMTALVIVIAGVWDQKKPSQIGVDKVGVVLTATLDAEDGVQDAKAPDAPMDIQVTEGRQDALTFMEADGSVDNAALVVSPGGEPFTGALRFDPGAEGGGRFVAKGADGREVGLELKGEMLQLGSPLTAWAFDLGLAPIGDFGALIVTLCVFLFAVSTIISWSYYGDRCVTYLFGTRYVIVYRAVYIGFVYLGATTALETVWTFGDVALGLMTVPNLIAVLLLSPKIVQLSRDYFKRMKEESR